MKKQNGITNFKTPEGYFETFEEELFSKISEIKLPKKNGFAIPKNYFENLEQRIAIPRDHLKKERNAIPLFSKKYFGYAAAIAICFSIGATFFTNQSPELAFDTLQWAAIDSYIEEGNLNLDLDDVTTMIENSTLSEIELQEQDLSQSDLENYLFDDLYMDITKNNER